MARYTRVLIAWAAIVVIIFASARVPEKIGDKLQVALPLAAFGCAIAGGDGIRFFGRYLLLEAGVKIPKLNLGDAPINRRPDGGLQGFPSGHMAAATFGATGLAASCMNQSKLGQGTVLMAAAFTGTSRVEAERHTIWQVLAGAIWGWFAQCAALTWFDRLFGRLAGAVIGGLKRLRGVFTSAGAIALASFAATPQGASAEVDLQFYTGWQTAPHSVVSGDDPAGAGPFDFVAGWEGRSFGMPPHYGLRAVWWRSDLWGYDVDFNHTKVYADAETLGAAGTSGGFEVLEFTDGLNALTVGAVRRWPGQWGAITPHLGAGLGIAIPHVEVQSNSTVLETRGYQFGGPVVTWRMGGSMDLNADWGLFAEYKGTYTLLDVNLDGGGRLQSDIVTNAINFGVTYTLD